MELSDTTIKRIFVGGGGGTVGYIICQILYNQILWQKLMIWKYIASYY